MQGERITPAVHPNLAIAGPADNREQHRSGAIPDIFVQLPDQFHAPRPPAAQSGAEWVDLRDVVVGAGEQNHLCHLVNLAGTAMGSTHVVNERKPWRRVLFTRPLGRE